MFSPFKITVSIQAVKVKHRFDPEVKYKNNFFSLCSTYLFSIKRQYLNQHHYLFGQHPKLMWFFPLPECWDGCPCCWAFDRFKTIVLCCHNLPNLLWEKILDWCRPALPYRVRFYFIRVCWPKLVYDKIIKIVIT